MSTRWRNNSNASTHKQLSPKSLTHSEHLTRHNLCQHRPHVTCWVGAMQQQSPRKTSKRWGFSWDTAGQLKMDYCDNITCTKVSLILNIEIWINLIKMNIYMAQSMSGITWNSQCARQNVLLLSWDLSPGNKNIEMNHKFTNSTWLTTTKAHGKLLVVPHFLGLKQHCFEFTMSEFSTAVKEEWRNTTYLTVCHHMTEEKIDNNVKHV